jgi:hypothetical protein
MRSPRLVVEALEDRTVPSGLGLGAPESTSAANAPLHDVAARDLTPTPGGSPSTARDAGAEVNLGIVLQATARVPAPGPDILVAQPPLPAGNNSLVAIAPSRPLPAPRPITVFSPGSSGTQAVGEISGRVAPEDLNGQAGVARQIVYLDLNRNGVRDEHEPATVTDHRGAFHFGGLPLGTYVVRQVVRRPRAEPDATPGHPVTLAPGRWTATLQHLRRSAHGLTLSPAVPEDEIESDEPEELLQFLPVGEELGMSHWKGRLGVLFSEAAPPDVRFAEPGAALAACFLWMTADLGRRDRQGPKRPGL